MRFGIAGSIQVYKYQLIDVKNGLPGKHVAYLAAHGERGAAELRGNDPDLDDIALLWQKKVIQYSFVPGLMPQRFCIAPSVPQLG